MPPERPVWEAEKGFSVGGREGVQKSLPTPSQSKPQGLCPHRPHRLSFPSFPLPTGQIPNLRGLKTRALHNFLPPRAQKLSTNFPRMLKKKYSMLSFSPSLTT